MDITIKGYRAIVNYINGRPAFGRFLKEPKLVVWIEIDKECGMSGFAITIPLKEYAPDELKRVIEEEGARQFDASLSCIISERKNGRGLRFATHKAQVIARKVAKAAGIKLLEDPVTPRSKVSLPC